MSASGCGRSARPRPGVKSVSDLSGRSARGIRSQDPTRDAGPDPSRSVPTHSGAPAPCVAPTQEHVIPILVIGLNAAPEPTGIAPYTSGMTEHLAARGDEVELITAFPHYPEWRFTAGTPAWRERSVQGGVAVTRVRHVLPKRGSALSRVLSEASFGVRALFSRWGSPDVVVLVSPALFASAMVLPRLLIQRLPFVVWVQDLYGLGVQETGRGGRLGGLVARLEGWVLRRADAVVVIHEQMAAAVERLGVAPENLTVVRNWTHIETGARRDRAVVRARFGWRPEETVVLHTGNMGAKQDLRNVVEAAREADRLQAPVRFVLMGDGVERPVVEAAATGVTRVQLLPSQPSEEYQSILQAADVLLVNEHPGVREMALPSKLTSYFASGRPVLAASNDDGATAAELRRAAAGVLVAPGRPEELLHAVRALAADEELGRSLAAAGDRYRRTVLSLEGAGRAFGGVLDGLRERYGTVDDLVRTMSRTDTVPVLLDHR
jgi:colanic acid biosynthesis glycosyl transferase WcaI